MTTELNFDRHINLADEKLGAEAIFATDDFFADKQRMLKTEAAVFVPDLYDENGKWMDGWESRRKRHEGYDYCIVRLGLPGSIEGLVKNQKQKQYGQKYSVQNHYKVIVSIYLA
ncbi:hypothetical protein ACPSKX_07610 [Moritella viscosa]